MTRMFRIAVLSGILASVGLAFPSIVDAQRGGGGGGRGGGAVARGGSVHGGGPARGGAAVVRGGGVYGGNHGGSEDLSSVFVTLLPVVPVARVPTRGVYYSHPYYYRPYYSGYYPYYYSPGRSV